MMEKRIKQGLKDGLQRTGLGRKLLVWHRFLALWPELKKLGWQRSVETGTPVDRDGNALPWFTYASIAFLSKRIRPEMTVFEYGSGGSTIWWSRRVSRVIACEHDLEWFQAVAARVPANVELLYRELTPAGAYTQTIQGYTRQFDIIVIDGRDRVQCAMNSLAALKDDGVLIWDNSDRPRYREGFAFLRDHGFKRLDFAGDGPINAFRSCTSIFYRAENCLGI